MAGSEGNPIRILQVVGKMDRGGAETLIMHVYRHIDRAQVQFDFFVHTDQPGHFDSEITALGGRVFAGPEPAQVGFRAYRRALTGTLRDSGPFAGVHSHVYDFSGYVLRVAEQAEVPLRMAHGHTAGDGRQESWLRSAYSWHMRRLIRRHATHMFGCSRVAAESLFGLRCWKDPRVRVIPNAIDLTPYAALPDDREALRERAALSVDTPLLGHVGRFSPVKNHLFLIKVFSALLQQVPRAHLALIGDGPLRPKVEALVETARIGDHVHFLGVRPDIPQILGALDLFLFPSLYEGLGIVLVEAQAAGVPCVVSNGLPTEVDMHLGLVKPVDLQAHPERWVQEILEALKTERPAWSDRYRALVAAGYDIRSVAGMLQGIYVGEH
jgi:glycosyltransferase involved in cell wall biosynthesis